MNIICFSYTCEKNDVVEILLLDHENNYVENSHIMIYATKNFDILVINLNVLQLSYLEIQQNYFIYM